MMKKLCVAIVVILALFLISCESQRKAKPIKVKLTVTDTDGRVPEMFHVQIMRGQKEFTYRPQYVSKGDSQVEIVLKEKGLWYVAVISPDHSYLRFPLIQENIEEGEEIHIVLSPHKYKEKMDELFIIMGRPDNMQKMNDEGDGVFSYEFKYEDERERKSARYQVMGLFDFEQYIAGNDYDSLFPDSGGDYTSIVELKDNYRKIIIDTKKLYRPKNDSKESVKFIKSKFHNELNDIYRRSFELWVSIIHMKDEPEDEETARKVLMEIIDPLLEYLKATYSTEKGELSSFAAIQYYENKDKFGAFYEIDPVEAKELWDKIGVSSVCYSAIEGLPARLAKQAGDLSLIYTNRGKFYNKEIEGLALCYASYYYRQAAKIKESEELLDLLMDNYRKNPVVARIIMKVIPGLGKGDAVPEFSYKDFITKKKISNETLKGKYYIIDFWATWCGPCIGDTPHLQKAYEKYKDKLNILSISLDRDPKKLKTYLEKEKLPWNHAFMKDGFQEPFVIKFRVSGIPTPVLVDPEGKIVTFGGLRGERLLETLEAEFNPEKASATETSAQEAKNSE
ncbi:TlpA family protein disulfide reductase [bacterium]|nr:TlpA family protein disulfide reductase [bacterium]